VDPLAARAAEDYHRLLRDDEALVEELEARFFERMREARLTFGGRVLCAFPRPNFVAPSDYEAIRTVCRDIFRAIEKVESRLGEDLWARVDLTPEEAELVRLDPGYRRSSPTSRLDSFITTEGYRFVELNAESPAGIAYNEVLVDIFLDLPVMKKFQEKWKLHRFRARERLLETLIACHREAGGKEERPTIAVVDYEEVPTRSEHHLFRDFFEKSGYPALVCDPRQLVYDGGRLRHDGTAIDIVYKRLLTNEFLEKVDELQPLLEAIKARAVTVVNPFRCKPIHKKAIFAVLTDDELQPLFTDHERRAIAALDAARPRGIHHPRRPAHRPRRSCPRPPRGAGPQAQRRIRRQGRVHRLGVDGDGVGSGPRHRTAGVLRRAGEGRSPTPELSRARPRPPLPRPGGRPRPLRLPRRGRRLPDPLVGHVASQRHVGRRPGPSLPGRAKMTTDDRPREGRPSARASRPQSKAALRSSGALRGGFQGGFANAHRECRVSAPPDLIL
jgi:hypothetical protein